MKIFSKLFLILLLFAAVAIASESDEKSPENQATEVLKKATKEYNRGVKYMVKAKEKLQKGDSAYAFNYRATSLAKAKKEYEKAIKKFNKAIKLNPEFVEAHSNLGYCFRKIGNFASSLSSYNTALTLDSSYAPAREYLGETYLALDSLNKAVMQWELLLSIDSAYADTLNKSIEIYKLTQLSNKLELK